MKRFAKVVAWRDTRKLEESNLEALVPQHVTIAVPCQDLQTVAIARAKQEQVPATLHPSRSCLFRRLTNRFFITVFSP